MEEERINTTLSDWQPIRAGGARYCETKKWPRLYIYNGGMLQKRRKIRVMFSLADKMNAGNKE